METEKNKNLQEGVKKCDVCGTDMNRVGTDEYVCPKCGQEKRPSGLYTYPLSEPDKRYTRGKL